MRLTNISFRIIIVCTVVFTCFVPLAVISNSSPALADTCIVEISAGYYHTVALKSDGTVLAVGDNAYGQCNIGSWTGVIQVSAGGDHTVGLKPDGTVVAVGYNAYEQCNIGSWTGITQVSAGYYHTVALKSDGTVFAVGDNTYGQCNVGSWTNIIQVAGGYRHTVGLKADGTVVAAGWNDAGQCNVSFWTGIIEVAAGGIHTVGLKSGGTVVAVGDNSDGRCDVGSWTGVTQVSAGGGHSVGLKSNGAVVSVGDNTYGECNVGSWTSIDQMSAGYEHTVGLKFDGTVIAIGWNYWEQCEVGGWDYPPCSTPTSTPTPSQTPTATTTQTPTLTPTSTSSPTPSVTTSSNTIYVDCDNTTGIENGTQLYPYNTIQEGIDAASEGTTILVSEGVYYENPYLISGIILKGASTSLTQIQGHVFMTDDGSSEINGFTITGSESCGIHCRGSSSLIIKNNIITGNVHHGIGCFDSSSPVIVNNVIVGNDMSGINCESTDVPIITNNIIVTNEGGGITCASYCSPIISYNDIWGNTGVSGCYTGSGGIYVDPLFVNPSDGDYHLQAASPCIDAGDPASDYSNEPEPNGDRVNMGAYGNTEEAALSLSTPSPTSTPTITPTPTSSTNIPATSLTAPQLVNPTGSVTVTDNTPTFQWMGVTDATNYTIQLSKSYEFWYGSLLIDTTLGDVQAYESTTILENGTYYWRVQASDVSSESGWSSTGSFTVDQTTTQQSFPLWMGGAIGGGAALLTLVLIMRWNSKRMAGAAVKNMRLKQLKEQMEKWRKQGYDVSHLEDMFK